MTTNQEQQAAGPVALGAVTLDLQRLTPDELARLFRGLQAELRRRHAEQQRAG